MANTKMKSTCVTPNCDRPATARRLCTICYPKAWANEAATWREQDAEKVAARPPTEEGERWAPVVGFEGLYLVSDRGRVYSAPRKVASWGARTGFHAGGLLSPSTPSERSGAIGYPFVCLRRNGRGHVKKVHCLVAEAFLGPRPPGAHVAHCDGNEKNNALGNLAYKTPIENAGDKHKHGTTARGETHARAKVTEAQVRQIRALNKTGSELAIMFGISRCTALAIKRGALWRHVV